VEEKKSKIIGVHLLNDFSGSPLVFSQALQALQSAGHEIVIHTSNGRNGFLDRVIAKKEYFPYKFYSNAVVRLFAFCFSQLFLFFQLMQYRKQDVVIYVNTLLPFGAALAGRWMNKKVFYHVHESYIQPAPLKSFLRFVAAKTAHTVFYVSYYLFKEECIEKVNACVIHNTLPDTFVSKAKEASYSTTSDEKFVVLMVCSLKEYKGVPQFLSLAKRHPNLTFELVLNASEDDIKEYFKSTPDNLKIFSVQKDLDAFYSRASLVMNLTNPDVCIETFGMTLLEAMCYGVPVIAPNCGGPTEIVVDAKNGFQISVKDEALLDFRLEFLSKNPDFMQVLSDGARKTAQGFESEKFRNAIISEFESCKMDVRN